MSTDDELYQSITTEAEARAMVWWIKFSRKDFKCPNCKNLECYQLKNPEIRKCKKCMHKVRLRAGTIFEHSKTPILLWIGAIYHCMQDNNGISALKLNRTLNMKFYETTWTMLHKIREALRQKDLQHKLGKYIKINGAFFGSGKAGNQIAFSVAIGISEWSDVNGCLRYKKEGFVKVLVANKIKSDAQNCINEDITPLAVINPDGSSGLINLQNMKIDYPPVANGRVNLDKELPWIKNFIARAKGWLKGTPHGVDPKYLPQYMAEYTYRFNRKKRSRRFRGALVACVLASPTRQEAPS